MKYLTRTTQRLVIRPLTAKDYSSWRQAHLTMPTSQNTWDLGPRPSNELTKTHFKNVLKYQTKRRQLDSFYDFGVFDKKKRLIGNVSLMEVSRGISQTSYLGYRIFSDHWGRGYAKEAVKAILDIGFRDLKLHRIEAGIEPENRRSLSLAKNLRMRREGLKKRALYLRKKWVDLVMYTLTSEDVRIKYDTSKLVQKKRS